jgi:hypothetical protein
MALWGTKDDIASPGTVALSGLTVTGTSTFFANNYATGDIITIADAGGDAVIASITNETSMLLASNTELTSGTLTGKAYTVSEKPIYVIQDSNLDSSDVYGVDTDEMAASSNTGFHAGWVSVNRYTDTHGNTRVKYETLVASSSITADADDDSEFADS